MQFDNINFEIYSKITGEAFHSTRNGISEFGCIITFYPSLLSSYFTNFRPQANAVALVLA